MPDRRASIWHNAQRMISDGQGGNDMSDTESNQRNPLSSSSSNVSGTQALSITIDAEPTEGAIQTGAPASQEPDTVQVTTEGIPVVSNENTPASVESVETGTQPHIEDDKLAADASETQPQIPSEPEAMVQAALDDGPEPDTVYHYAPDSAEAEVREEDQYLPEPEYIEQTPPDADEELLKTREALHEDVLEKLTEHEHHSDKTFEMFDQLSSTFKTAMEDARNDATLISFKLLEFAQKTLRNNVEFAQGCASAKTVPDVLSLQTAYLKRQFELMNQQAVEIRLLTTEMASKKAVQFQSQIKYPGA